MFSAGKPSIITPTRLDVTTVRVDRQPRFFAVSISTGNSFSLINGAGFYHYDAGTQALVPIGVRAQELVEKVLREQKYGNAWSRPGLPRAVAAGLACGVSVARASFDPPLR
jgi:hypothetical protein